MEGDEDVRKLWSDAPKDILALILSKLYAGDVVAFYNVCKAWSKIDRVSIVERTLRDKELCTIPCLIFPNKRFFHPLSNTWLHVDTTYELPKAAILTANYGWLLMNRPIQRDFFFNPFTGDRIDLPERFYGIANFSAPPTSHECEVFMFEVQDPRIVVQTIKRGEDKISTKDVCAFDDDSGFDLLRDYKTVFFKGKYICLGMKGDLVIYNPNKIKHGRKKSKHCRTDSAIKMWRHLSAHDCERYLFEGEGDLWAIFIAKQGKEVCVCRLNLNNMIWERVYDLGDRMVFLSYASCLMVRTKIRGTSNKIFLPKLMEGYCLFYSLATNRYHTFRKVPHESISKDCSSYESYHGSIDMVGCTWIYMNVCPPSQSCMEELSWRSKCN